MAQNLATAGSSHPVVFGCAAAEETHWRYTGETTATGISWRRLGWRRAGERAAMCHLLYLIVELNRTVTRLMISALVGYLDSDDVGSGFYAYAQDLGMLSRSASEEQKLAFWAGQVRALHKYYGGAGTGSGG